MARVFLVIAWVEAVCFHGFFANWGERIALGK